MHDWIHIYTFHAQLSLDYILLCHLIPSLVNLIIIRRMIVINEYLRHDTAAMEAFLLLLRKVLLKSRVIHEWETFLKGVVRGKQEVSEDCWKLWFVLQQIVYLMEPLLGHKVGLWVLEAILVKALVRVGRLLRWRFDATRVWGRRLLKLGFWSVEVFVERIFKAQTFHEIITILGWNFFFFIVRNWFNLSLYSFDI